MSGRLRSSLMFAIGDVLESCESEVEDALPPHVLGWATLIELMTDAAVESFDAYVQAKRESSE